MNLSRTTMAAAFTAVVTFSFTAAQATEWKLVEVSGTVRIAAPGKAPAPRGTAVSSQSVAGLASAIQRQVQPCANKIPNPGPGANQIRSRIRLQMRSDGTFAARPELRGQTGIDDENRRYAQRVSELAIAALTQCAPYELPADLYEGGWKDIIINYKLPG